MIFLNKVSIYKNKLGTKFYIGSYFKNDNYIFRIDSFAPIFENIKVYTTCKSLYGTYEGTSLEYITDLLVTSRLVQATKEEFDSIGN